MRTQKVRYKNITPNQPNENTTCDNYGDNNIPKVIIYIYKPCY